jgi:hypothetical protein
MKIFELKSLIIRSLDRDSDPVQASLKLGEAGVSYSFSEGFQDKILDRLAAAGNPVVREIESVRNLNNVFYRIALSGVAAIVILLISIFMVQGSLSVDSFLGLGTGSDESLLYLLTGN